MQRAENLVPVDLHGNGKTQKPFSGRDAKAITPVQAGQKLASLVPVLSDLARYAELCADACKVVAVFGHVERAVRRDLAVVRKAARQLGGLDALHVVDADDSRSAPPAAWDTRISSLNACQQQIVQVIDTILPAIQDADLSAALKDIRDGHAERLAQCEPLANLNRPTTLPKAPERQPEPVKRHRFPLFTTIDGGARREVAAQAS